MKLTNLKITPKLGILVGVTLLGLCAAGVLAGYLMQREMLNARIEQTRPIVDMARNMAAGLQKQVEAGQMTKEAAIAEFGKRGNTLTYRQRQRLSVRQHDGRHHRAGARSEPVGKNRMDVVTNGRKLCRANCATASPQGRRSHAVLRHTCRPGQEEPIRKVGYAVADSRLQHVCRHRRLSRRLDAKLKPIAWLLGPRHPRHRA